MGFECKHCGICCSDECAQINLSIQDILRICNHLKCDISEVIGVEDDKKIWLKPFYDYETKIYDVELGLHLPCRFRKNGKCSIYSARPLNCRIFPYFILTSVNTNKILDHIDNTHACVKNSLAISDREREIYRKYTSEIGEQILSEAKITEEFYKKYSIKQKISIQDLTDAKNTCDNNTNKTTKEKDKKRVLSAIKLIKTENYNDLVKNLKKFLQEHKTEISFNNRQRDQIKNIKN